MKKTSKILIIGEIQNQHAAHVTVELLGVGRKLADSLDAELQGRCADRDAVRDTGAERLRE